MCNHSGCAKHIRIFQRPDVVENRRCDAERMRRLPLHEQHVRQTCIAEHPPVDRDIIEHARLTKSAHRFGVRTHRFMRIRFDDQRSGLSRRSVGDSPCTDSEAHRFGKVALHALLEAVVVEPLEIGGRVLRDGSTRVARGFDEMIDDRFHRPIECFRQRDHQVNLRHSTLWHKPSWLPSKCVCEFLHRPTSIRSCEGL
jgi:hypothetical protein